jgi:Rieske Fe-S protein
MANRRKLLKISLISFSAMVVAACTKKSATVSSAISTSPTDEIAPAPTSSETATNSNIITSLDSIAVGESFPFVSLAGTNAILFRSSTDKVYALSRICTHQGCEVNFEKAGNKLVCPCHGANYQASDGAVISGPTTESLAKINVVIEANNIVELV